MLVRDSAVGCDDKAFGNSVDPPVDRRASCGVDTDGGKRIPERAKKASGILGLVLVVDPHDPNLGITGEFDEQRMLVPAGHAPGCPDIDHSDAPQKIRPGQARYRRSISGETFHRR